MSQSGSSNSTHPVKENHPGELFNQAVNAFNARQFTDAGQYLNELLLVEPENANALSLLATIQLQTQGPSDKCRGMMERAVQIAPTNVQCLKSLGTYLWMTGDILQARDIFEKASEVSPEDPEVWFNLGNTMQRVGDLDGAEKAFLHAIRLQNNFINAYSNLALIYLDKLQYDDAINTLQQVLNKGVKNASIHGNLGLAFQKSGQLEASITQYNKALQLDPNDAGYYVNLSSVYFDLGDSAEAMDAVRQALLLDSGSIFAYNNLGTLLMHQGKDDEALAAYLAAKNISDNYPEIDLHIGTAYYNLKRFDEGIAVLESVLKKRPDWPIATLNLANCYFKKPDQQEMEKSIALYDRVIASGNEELQATAYTNKGFLKYLQCNPREALDDYDQAIAYSPDHKNARFGRSLVLLKLGDMEKGWKEYQWRFYAMGHSYNLEISWAKPEWDGQPFEGKTLLVHHEQGLGDALHFVRYIPMVKKLGGDIIVRCGPPLFRLFESIDGIKELLSRKEHTDPTSVEYDLQVSMVSLPYLFNTTLDTIPDQVPYLGVEQQMIDHWADKLGKPGFKVGLVWSGNPDQGDNDHRSCSLTNFKPLLEIENITFVSLQVGVAEAQISELDESCQLINVSPELYDFAETAAVIKNLDLVITIDTSVAHLAGGLGHPVWVLLWTAHCWRYLENRTDSPWYPSMRLFEQPSRGDWASVIQEVKTELIQLACQ